MLDAMRYFHGIALKAVDDSGGLPTKEAADAHASGATIAKDAAPFMHPKLASIEHSGPDGGDIGFTFNLDRANSEEG